MKCPLDGADLLITERQGVEIDYCPTCRGVWLDRGELDKLVERAESYDKRDRSRDDDDDYDYRRDQNNRQPYPQRPAGGDIAGMVGEVLKGKMGDRDRHHGDYRGDHYGRKKKKGGLLGDLFDFKALSR